MNNHMIKLMIEPKDIHNRLPPEQKKQFKEIKITNTTLCDNGVVEIECLALEEEINKSSYVQKIFVEGYISAF